jgi:hypothetical protein
MAATASITATAPDAAKLKKQIRSWTVFFMISIALSGITAFPLETEVQWLSSKSEFLPDYMAQWVNKVDEGITATNIYQPFIFYGTDWLAFAHLIIGMLFIGLLRDPVRNRWIVEWGILCCLLVFPLALIAGPVRHIPFFHQVIDCCFGVVGLIPLLIVRRKITQLESING